MKVLSLCDGISCGLTALKRKNIKVDKYYASEIADYSIKIAKKNHPEIEHIGDMTLITEEFLDSLDGIDLLLSGTPCKSLSRTNSKEYKEGLNGTSKLFWDFVKIKNYLKPTYFLFENVESMKDEDRDIISEALGVQPIMINSSSFSAQDRKRYYWTNIPVVNITSECSLVLKDIMEKDVDEKYFYKDKTYIFNGEDKRVIATINLNTIEMNKRVYNENFKSPTLTAVTGGYQEKKVYDKGRCRKLTPLEYERLQTLPDNYTAGLSNSKRYCACGDGWTVDAIAHILDYFSR